MTKNLLHAVTTARAVTDKVTVLFSGGKDSVCTLDLCRRFFPAQNVKAAFMYYVRGLSFQDQILDYYEKLYDMEIIRVPHFELSSFFRYGVLRPPDESVPNLKTAEVYDYIRELTGTYWLAGGERINDSMVRRAMIKRSGSIDRSRGRFYPLAEWSKSDVMEYIKKQHLKTSPESAVLGFSFRSLNDSEMMKIKQYYPEDYERIKRWFPLLDVTLNRYGGIEANG